MKPEDIKIERGVPLPPGVQLNGGSRSKYPWDKMKLGDSFAIPVGGRDPNALRQGLLTTAKGWALRQFKPWMFTSRLNAERTEVRIWRIQ